MTKPWREGKRKKPDLIAEREAAHLPKRSAPEPRFVVLIYLWSNPGEMYVHGPYYYEGARKEFDRTVKELSSLVWNVRIVPVQGGKGFPLRHYLWLQKFAKTEEEDDG